MRIEPDSKLCNVALSAMDNIVKTRVLVCAVLRNGESITPNGNFVLKEGDRIFVTAPTSELAILLKNLGILTRRVRSCLIGGGGRISYYLAQLLEKVIRKKKENPEKFSMFSAPFIQFLMVILKPVNWVFAQWKKLLAVLFKSDDNRGITEDELLTIVEEAKTEGAIEEEQSELIQNAIEFNDLEAWDVITPRVDIKAIEIDSTKKEVAKMFLETGFSRLPVYDGDLDKILGVLNQKDFHNHIDGSKKTISDFVKPVIYVAGSMKAAVLLKKLQMREPRKTVRKRLPPTFLTMTTPCITRKKPWQ